MASYSASHVNAWPGILVCLDHAFFSSIEDHQHQLIEIWYSILKHLSVELSRVIDEVYNLYGDVSFLFAQSGVKIGSS